MEKTIVIDTNLIVRYFQKDNEILSAKTREIFDLGQKGEAVIYLDEIIVAEVVWVSQSFYKMSRKNISGPLKKLIYQSWVVNPRKELILQALDLYEQDNFSFADCWIYVISKKLEAKLETFDNKLKKLK